MPRYYGTTLTDAQRALSEAEGRGQQVDLEMLRQNLGMTTAMRQINAQAEANQRALELEKSKQLELSRQFNTSQANALLLGGQQGALQKSIADMQLEGIKAQAAAPVSAAEKQAQAYADIYKGKQTTGPYADVAEADRAKVAEAARIAAAKAVALADRANNEFPEGPAETKTTPHWGTGWGGWKPSITRPKTPQESLKSIDDWYGPGASLLMHWDPTEKAWLVNPEITAAAKIEYVPPRSRKTQAVAPTEGPPPTTALPGLTPGAQVIGPTLGPATNRPALSLTPARTQPPISSFNIYQSEAHARAAGHGPGETVWIVNPKTGLPILITLD